MHHYNFPGYSTGEAKFRPQPPTAARIGHGALAERALLPVLPSVEDFPYAIRVVSEVLSSNGSTSQGSICGSTLALMDAGVPISAPVAGISCGLIQDDNGGFTTFIDIQGVEDFHGEMDFKVAGTKKGITAIQMDLKNDGLTMESSRRRWISPMMPAAPFWTRSCCPASPSPGLKWPYRAQDGQDEDRCGQDPRGHRLRRQGHPEDRVPTPAPRWTSTTTAPSSFPAKTASCDAAKKMIDDHRIRPRGGQAVLRQAWSV
jgi:hypothetical protein